MVRFLARSLLLTLAFALVTGLARLVGATSPYPELSILQIDPDQFPRICWQGICLGQTSVEEAERILRRNKERFGAVDILSRGIYWGKYRDTPPGIGGIVGPDFTSGRVGTIYFFPARKVRLGDLLVLFGEPNGILPCISTPPAQSRVLSIGMVFKRNIVAFARGRALAARQPLEPGMIVDEISYIEEEVRLRLPAFYRDAAGNWHGFQIVQSGPSC